ncbi:MAG: TlpA family protein disulfide reductase [Lachnospiraceae bacterium]|nr:TlpA family protein disulfide reductase [Lachnospiraceae bacterium]
MKCKLVSILMICLLLVGCTSDTGEIHNMTKEGSADNSVQTQIGEVQEEEQEVQDGNGTEGVQDTTAENASEKSGSEISDEEAGSDAYVVSFEAATIEGEDFTSECFSKSRLTMINIWATYCNPCLSEMPDLGEIAASYDASDFQMVGIISDVAEDADEETIKAAKELIEQTKADYPHLLVNESLYLTLLLGVDSVPTTFFVNQKGELLGYVVGAQSRAVWEELITKLLEENK